MSNGVTVSNIASVSQQQIIDSLTAQLAKANERIAELESYNVRLANESHNKSLEIDKANERAAIYKRGINKAIEAIEREDDSSAYDAISHLESALQLRKEQE